MTQMDSALVESYVALGTLGVTVVGLALVIVQLHQLGTSVRSAAHAAIYAQGAAFRVHLVEFPHLRRFFFDGATIAPGDEHYERALTIAELFLNHLEQIAVTIDSFGRRNRAPLEAYITNALSTSPLMKGHLAEHRARYSPALLRFVG